MNPNILTELESRIEFITHLENDIAKNDKFIEDTTSQKGALEELVNNIKYLAVYPEHEALIPLSKNIYMKGKITHTGEYYIKNKAHPDSYYTLNTLDNTIKSLEKNVNMLENNIDKAEYAKYQLEERMTLLKGKSSEEVDDTLPKEIHSDKGVAVKVGEFYEILEFEPGN